MSNGMRGIPGTGLPVSVTSPAAGSAMPHGGHCRAAVGPAFKESFRAANLVPSAGPISTSLPTQTIHADGGSSVQQRKLGWTSRLAICLGKPLGVSALPTRFWGVTATIRGPHRVPSLGRWL